MIRRYALAAFVLLASSLALPHPAQAQAPAIVPPPPAPVDTTPAPANSGKDKVPFTFAKPADEMDFGIKPVPQAGFDTSRPISQGGIPSMPGPAAIPTPPAPPTLPTDSESEAAAAAAADPCNQFFSTTTMIDCGREPEAVAPAVDAEPEVQPATVKVNKRIIRPRFLRAGPPFPGFHSVRLPEPIYSKNYSRPNLSLPIKIAEDDLQGALALAVVRGRVADLRAIVRSGADMNYPTANGESLVILGTRYGQADAVRWLLQHGASANVTDGQGLTALHYAAYRNDHVITNLLLQYGADYSAANAKGVTPMQIAQHNGASNAVEVLRRAGASG